MLVSPDRPHTVARCPGAIDAVCLMYTNTKYTKEAMLPRTGTWTLNEFIMAGGQCTSDNLPPRYSAMQYAWRSPTLDMQERIFQVLVDNAEQAAKVTGCRVTHRWVTQTRVGLANHALAALTYRNLELIRPPAYGEEARGFGREIQRNLGLTPMDDAFTEDNQRLTSPQEWEDIQRQGLPSWQANFTADDYVDYTWHAPTVRLHTARPRLKTGDKGHTYPAWVVNAMGGVSPCIDPGMFLAGKAIAATFVDLITQRKGPVRVQGKDRRRYRRNSMDGTSASSGLPPAGRSALARIRSNASWRRVVDSDADRLRDNPRRPSPLPPATLILLP